MVPIDLTPNNVCNLQWHCSCPYQIQYNITLSLAYNYNCINFIDTIHLYFAPTSGAGQLTLQRECGRMQARESGSSRKPYYSNVRRLNEV